MIGQPFCSYLEAVGDKSSSFVDRKGRYWF